MIVLLEDDPAIRDLTIDLLREREGAVYAATNPEAVESIVGAIEVDLLLADPKGATKEEALQRLRRLARQVAGRTRVVAFTAHNMSSEEAREAGCAGVIGKPFDIDELSRRVEEHLGAGRHGCLDTGLEGTRSTISAYGTHTRARDDVVFQRMQHFQFGRRIFLPFMRVYIC